MEQLGACGVAVACSPSGSNGRVRGAARRVGAPQRRQDGASWRARQEAMSGSAARRVGGVDERRRQATLLHPFVNGVRVFDNAWLLSLPCRSPVAHGGLACGSRRHRTGSGASLPTLPWGQRRNRGGREKEEREVRRVNRSLTQNDSNFCIETRKTVNIKVVGNSKIYNFCVGQNFIRVMV